MYQISSPTIFVALLSLICLIVYFIMASRIGAIKKNTDYIKAYLRKKANSEGFIKTIQCTNTNCKSVNEYFDIAPVKCSVCNTDLPKE